ncbi:hypothetical protein [Pelagicoccus sp. SDUM812003]|uniref:hypothetical protein n=1 Tax=Pelagicoccus sp. SDUM812003 TaxID=3041267 RepID=UPI0028108E98|nr:hypothetical protein [Pelagicoccus sp. SDUM812003]MDQ8201418.1 hypothetical protein [Pelagicoccus sp. SDUM812003]
MIKDTPFLVLSLALGLSLQGPNLGTEVCAQTDVPDSLTLFDFDEGFDLGSVESNDANASLIGEGDRQLLVETGIRSGAPGVTLKRSSGSWDLDPYYHVKMDIRNVGEHPAKIIFKVGDPEDDMEGWQMEIRFDLKPGETKTVADDISTSPWRFAEPLELVAMRAAPGSAKTDLSAIDQVRISIVYPDARHKLVIDNIRATNPVRWVGSEGFLPFVDRFGQYKHADWPGKVYSSDDLRQLAREEDRRLASHPGPSHFCGFGGWKEGPQLEATGFFRTEKLDGAWWLVDPDGHLFWSHGVCCVDPWASSTGVTDREGYFEWIPEKDSRFGQFFGKAHGAAHGFYKGRGERDTYSFHASNLFRKFGENWREGFRRVAHARLRSWGMNTAGVASDREFCQDGVTPYTETVWVRGTRKIEASQGYWGPFHDVFDPSFRRQVRAALAGRERAANDSWCLGFFVENELSWGAEGSLAEAALASPADQPAKLEFVSDLRAKYADIQSLNAVWSTEYASWQALLQSTVRPDRTKAWDDLSAFYARIVETYFSTVREEMKAVAPNIMYLGCRLAWANSETVIRTAAKYQDVMSMNRYDYNVTNVGFPHGVDKPILIGEFHFGSLDRGSLHPGVTVANSQAERAKFYKVYVESALLNPYIVGTHWFQYGDQNPTGRGDGENYNVGLVDVADNPFPELTESVTDVGARMYGLRFSAAQENRLVQPEVSLEVNAMQVDEDMHKRSNL